MVVEKAVITKLGLIILKSDWWLAFKPKQPIKATSIAIKLAYL